MALRKDSRGRAVEVELELLELPVVVPREGRVHNHTQGFWAFLQVSTK